MEKSMNLKLENYPSDLLSEIKTQSTKELLRCLRDKVVGQGLLRSGSVFKTNIYICAILCMP